MNRLLLPICGCVLLATLGGTHASGQDGNDFGGVPVARPFQGGAGFPMPERVWIGGNAVNNGIGYDGSYFSAGAVASLGQDLLEGQWALDGRAHISQAGLLFGNIGMVRGIPFEQFKSDLRVGFFYDIDGAEEAIFEHTYHQIGVTGEFLSEYFDVRANGYFPIGANDFFLPTGIDSALTGFDLKAGFRPEIGAPWAVTVTAGGYYYRSDIVEPFGGFTGGLSSQPIPGMTAIFQINHDHQFKTTGLLGLQFHFGGRRGQGGSRQVQEAEPVQRNDHIVRVH